ncbi:MAG: WD40 repeat domain-containing protein [Anaerolineales bacterium]
MREFFCGLKNLFFYIILTFLLSTLITACNEGGFLSVTVPDPTASSVPTDTLKSLPDLSVKEVRYEHDSDEVCSLDFSLGRILVIVQNKGTVVSGNFTVLTNEIEQEVDTPINPGDEIELLFPGKETASIQLDVANNIDESDEGNNSIRVNLTIPQLPQKCFQTPTPEAIALSPVHVLEGHSRGVLSLDFSPDGGLLASGSIDNTLRLWTVENGSLLRTMYGHPFPILTLKFTPNGSFIVTGSTDGLGRLWRVSDGKLINTLEGHSGWINSLDVSKDGGWIATCADDYTVRIWRMFDAKEIQTIDEGMAIISEISFLLQNDNLVWAERNGLIRVRSIDGAWIQKFNQNGIPTSSLAVSPDGNFIISGHFNGDIKFWDTNNGKLLYTLKGHTGEVTSLSISQDRNLLVSGSIDGIPRVWNIGLEQTSPFLVYVLKGHTGPVNDVAFSPKGSLVATGSEDGRILFWEIPES